MDVTGRFSKWHTTLPEGISFSAACWRARFRPAGFGSKLSLKAVGYKSPNEKLNIASIGAGGKAASDINACSETENIVALCDVDDKNAKRIYDEFDKVTKYKDFRVMLDKEINNIDACIVTIPDFMHATAATWAMERGKHVYVQKPLAHTIGNAAG